MKRYLLLCCLAAGACADDSTVEPPVGTWSFDCRPLGPPGLFFAGTNVTTDRDWEITLALAQTVDGCDAPILTFRAFGTHVVHGPVDTPPGATAIDFVVSSRRMTLLDDEARDALAGLGCDASGFALGEEVNLDATGCGGFAASLEQCPADYDIFAIEGDTLYIGRRPASGDICAPERRPTELDRDWPFLRQ